MAYLLFLVGQRRITIALELACTPQNILQLTAVRASMQVLRWRLSFILGNHFRRIIKDK